MLQVINLTSPDGRYDSLYLSNYATINLRDEISRLDGVGNVSIFGVGQYSMRVWLNPRSLQAFGLTATGCRHRDPATEQSGRRGTDRHAARAAHAELPVHHQRPGPAGRRRAVREHHRQSGFGFGRSHHPHSRISVAWSLGLRPTVSSARRTANRPLVSASINFPARMLSMSPMKCKRHGKAQQELSGRDRVFHTFRYDHFHQGFHQ